jgi:hypothetical protein
LLLNKISRAGTVRIYACGQCSGGGTCTKCTGSTSHHWLKQEAMTSISHGSSPHKIYIHLLLSETSFVYAVFHHYERIYLICYFYSALFSLCFFVSVLRFNRTDTEWKPATNPFLRHPALLILIHRIILTRLKSYKD